MASPTVKKQPAPKPGIEDVTKDLGERIAGLHRARREAGIAEYGGPLMTFNGRDALADADAELADAQAYVHQARLERETTQEVVHAQQGRIAKLERHLGVLVALVPKYPPELARTDLGRELAKAAALLSTAMTLEKEPAPATDADANEIPSYQRMREQRAAARAELAEAQKIIAEKDAVITAMIENEKKFGQQVKDLLAERDALKAELARPATSPSPAMHLPAQMGELRKKLSALHSKLHDLDQTGHVQDTRFAELFDDVNAILRLVPVEHDDAQGGKPAEVAGS